MGISCKIDHMWKPQDLPDDKSMLIQVITKGLVPPGNNQLPEPMLTQFYDAKRRH